MSEPSFRRTDAPRAGTADIPYAQLPDDGLALGVECADPCLQIDQWDAHTELGARERAWFA